MKGERGPRLWFVVLLGIVVFAGLPLIAGVGTADGKTQKQYEGGGDSLTGLEELGKAIFFDENLSLNQNQSCASCHTPEAGWTGPSSEINAHGAVYEGSISGEFGNRKPPSSAYATPSPNLHYVIEKKEALFIGGNFWDGRATGEEVGTAAADQAQGPFLNPVEQALSDEACVVYRVCYPEVAYPVAYDDVFSDSCADIDWPADVATACETEGETIALSEEDRAAVETIYDNIAVAIAAYEGSSESNAYTSKYDYYLAGLVDLTKEEKKGLNMFKSTGKCANCHILDPGPNGEPPLFTDFTYDNLGVPRNPENPWYESDFNIEGDAFIDQGLGGFLKTRLDYQQFFPENLGKHKVPTLRNVDKRPSPEFVKSYTHNGYFKDLRRVVEFYSTRDRMPVCPDPFTTDEEAQSMGCWPEPEVAANVNDKELGKLNLTDDQIDAIVAFMKTLSDGYELP